MAGWLPSAGGEVDLQPTLDPRELYLQTTMFVNMRNFS